MSSDKWFYDMVLSLVAETTKMFPQLHQGRGNIPKKPIRITNKSLKRFITSLAQNGSELGCKDLSVFSTTQRRWGFPGGAVLKNLPANAGDSGNMSSTPGSGRYPAGGNGNPFQYSCLENSKDRGAGGLQSIGSQSQMRLSKHKHTQKRQTPHWDSQVWLRRTKPPGI